MISMLLMQWLFGAVMITRTLGVQQQHQQQLHAQVAASNQVMNQMQVGPTSYGRARCPSCPAPDCTLAESKHSCDRLDELPLTEKPLHRQTSYGSVPVHTISCKDWISGGLWVPRAQEPAWLTVDRWGMFGPKGASKDVKYEFQPPAECVHDGPHGDKPSFRKFDADKFLQTLSGKTIAFLGDSMVRQHYGMLTVLLDEAIIGHSLYYKKDARYLDAVREMYLRHNVTLKNQWLSGHNGDEALVRDTFPTIWRSDIMVVNIGAFFHAGLEHNLERTIRHFMEYARANYKGTIIWREYSPTHFDTRQCMDMSTVLPLVPIHSCGILC
jgi:hypothetical protein